MLYGDSLVDTAGISAYQQPCALERPADGVDAAEGAPRAFKREFASLSTLNMGLSGAQGSTARRTPLAARRWMRVGAAARTACRSIHLR